ncbi:MAG TPA: TonB family protein, partial [Anseongella sp.]|nr:TonB family protein [Anseongella sp.]
VKALLWINPFAYLYQRSLRSVHEYLADSVVRPDEKSRYAELMYEYSFYNKPFSLQNSFFDKTLLKRRIKMLHQKKSGKMRLVYLLTLPLLAGLAFTVSKAGNTRPAAGVSAVIADSADAENPRASTGSSAPGQLIAVSGKVTDIANNPLAGASIFLKESGMGTATDAEGRFVLKNVPPDAQLLFKMIGYEPHLAELNNNSIVNIRLNRKRERLDETVVVGYAPAVEKDTPAEEDAPPEEAGAPEEGEKVYSFASIEKMPAFPGGKEAIIKHIVTKFRYPKEARENNVEGTIEIGFVVDKEGNVTNPEVLKGLGKGCDEELIRVIKTLPRWEAGEQNGSKVAVYYIL